MTSWLSFLLDADQEKPSRRAASAAPFAKACIYGIVPKFLSSLGLLPRLDQELVTYY